MKVMIAIDGSETSRRAVAYVARHRQDLFAQVELTCLYIEKPPPLRAVGAFGADPGMPALAQVDPQAVVGPLLEQLQQAGFSPELDVREGEPGPEIVQAALDGDYELVVMGASEGGLLRRSVLGSVGKSVLSESPVPVLIVR